MTPSPRQVGNALAVLLRLPPDLLQVLVERAIDRLDALDPDPDAEPGHDAEPDFDDESAPHEGWDTWPPVNGPDGCGPLRLAGEA